MNIEFEDDVCSYDIVTFEKLTFIAIAADREVDRLSVETRLSEWKRRLPRELCIAVDSRTIRLLKDSVGNELQFTSILVALLQTDTHLLLASALVAIPSIHFKRHVTFTNALKSLGVLDALHEGSARAGYHISVVRVDEPTKV